MNRGGRETQRERETYRETESWLSPLLFTLSLSLWSQGAGLDGCPFEVGVFFDSLDNAYYIPNLSATAVLLKTNLPPNTSVRGPGWTQVREERQEKKKERRRKRESEREKREQTTTERDTHR